MQGKCENCGNSYQNLFTVIINNQQHSFDSFECAINKVAPRCSHCRSPIIGHGVEVGGKYYCCNHCAKNRTENASS